MQFIMSGSNYFLPPMPEEKNNLVLSWNQTQVLLLHKRPLWPLDHATSGKMGQLMKSASGPFFLLRDHDSSDQNWNTKMNNFERCEKKQTLLWVSFICLAALLVPVVRCLVWLKQKYFCSKEKHTSFHPGAIPVKQCFVSKERRPSLCPPRKGTRLAES